jgi:uncharacterized protein (DUF1800 family)
VRALNRFGLGARVGEREGIRDPHDWLAQQLEGPPPQLASSGLPTADVIADVLQRRRRARGARRREGEDDPRVALRTLAATEALAALTERVVTERPFVERLVAFWSNHLCVSIAAKPLLAGLAGHYEREAIRPHVLGQFEDMVLASAKHPAMLVYLDNAQSIGPSSAAAQRASRRGRTRGLNENYARELLELHTLGVSGGYTEDDVIALARMLTGWTVAGLGSAAAGATAERDAMAFTFRAAQHEPGPKRVLGVQYAQGGEAEGEAVVRYLCRHPSTATFIAQKLVRHFVADEPPPAAVETVAAVFRQTRGDLRAVARTLVRLPEAWDTAHRKFRTPQDWLVAVLRALEVRDAPRPLPQLLRELRQPLWGPPAPKGYADTRQEWLEPDALMNRAELARTIATRAAPTVTDPEALVELVEPAEAPALASVLSDTGIAVDERLALALSGPAFQWR